MITAVLLTGCSNSTEGTPQAASGGGSTAAKPEDDVVIKTRKQAPENIDCTPITATMVGTAAQATVTPRQSQLTNTCEFDAEPAVNGKPGEIIISLTGGKLNAQKNGDLDGNTVFLDASGSLCIVVVAIAPKRFLRVHNWLRDGNNVCERGKAVAKAVFDTLP